MGAPTDCPNVSAEMKAVVARVQVRTSRAPRAHTSRASASHLSPGLSPCLAISRRVSPNHIPPDLIRISISLRSRSDLERRQEFLTARAATGAGLPVYEKVTKIGFWRQLLARQVMTSATAGLVATAGIALGP